MSKLFYREYGSGKPLIILHGLLGSSDNWLLHGKLFAKTFNVFIIDQMNHGNSPHSQSINYKTLTIDLFNFIKSKNLSKVNIIGHSMGGKVAMKFALDYEHLVNKLVIVDIAPKKYPNNLNFNYIIQGINSAGITNDNLMLRMKNDQWYDVINVNLNSNFHIIKSILPNMVRNKKGKIIGITSVVANTGNPGQSNYTASKSGMISMYKSLALEVAQRNININLIAPGFVESPMTNKLSEAQKNIIMDKIPMKKFGIPDDIANLALFLSSDLSSYITGQTFHVNGGMLML